MKSNLLLALILVWLSGLSAFVGYIGYISLRSNNTTVATTERLNTLSATLQTVQTDVSNLSTTTNNTLQSTTITYDNADLNVWIEATGSTQYKAYLYLNDSANINITDVLPNDTTTSCNCAQLNYLSAHNLSPVSPDQVYVAEDMSVYCQYSTTSGYSGCVNVGNPCRQTIILIVPYPFGQFTTVKINRSYGSVCV